MTTSTEVYGGRPLLIASSANDLRGACCKVYDGKTKDWLFIHGPHSALQLCTACGCYNEPEEYLPRDRGPHFKGEKSVCFACTFDGGGWH